MIFEEFQTNLPWARPIRLKAEIGDKEVLPDEQFGFRQGHSNKKRLQVVMLLLEKTGSLH